VNLKEDQTRLYDPDSPHRFIATSGSVLSGVQSHFQVIDTSEQEYVAGVAFKPGGTVPFMRMPAHEASDADVPLESVWSPGRTAALRQRLLESASIDSTLDALEAVLHEIWRPPGLHPAVNFALAAFDRAPLTTSIAAVTDAIGLSAKRFIERFKFEVGLTPKRYCRIRRFQRALALSHRGRHVDWTRVALDCGYFDQAHFIHDFRSFAGLTPTGYQSARTSFQNHVKFLQSDDCGI
jgi:AraC-like DNA-binding protein